MIPLPSSLSYDGVQVFCCQTDEFRQTDEFTLPPQQVARPRALTEIRRKSIISEDEKKWARYLGRLTEPPICLTQDHAQAVAVVWLRISSRVSDIRPPIAYPGGEHGFQFAWKNEDFYLDIDVTEDGCFDWYFMDEKTGRDEGSEEPIREPSERLIRLLVRFCQNNEN